MLKKLTYIYTYLFIYEHTNIPVNAIARLPHLHSRDTQGQETFLAPSADNQTHNYDPECSNYHLSSIKNNMENCETGCV